MGKEVWERRFGRMLWRDCEVEDVGIVELVICVRF